MVRWPKRIPSDRRVKDFISVMDIGPTLLELTEVKIPPTMNGRSFFSKLTSEKLASELTASG